MKYELKYKNPEGSKYPWSKIGNVKTNEWGNLQAGLMVSRLKEVLEITEKNGVEWVNLALFEVKQEDNAQKTHNQEKANAYVPEQLNDDVPF